LTYKQTAGMARSRDPRRSRLSNPPPLADLTYLGSDYQDNPPLIQRETRAKKRNRLVQKMPKIYIKVSRLSTPKPKADLTNFGNDYQNNPPIIQRETRAKKRNRPKKPTTNVSSPIPTRIKSLEKPAHTDKQKESKSPAMIKRSDVIDTPTMIATSANIFSQALTNEVKKVPQIKNPIPTETSSQTLYPMQSKEFDWKKMWKFFIELSLQDDPRVIRYLNSRQITLLNKMYRNGVDEIPPKLINALSISIANLLNEKEEGRYGIHTTPPNLHPPP